MHVRQIVEDLDPGIPMNWIDKAKDESAGKNINLASLTPKFDEASHRVYYDLLARAIDAKGVRNVALTGAYGTGKSSILEQLRSERGDEVIEISLSTISPPRRSTDADGGQEDENSQTNLIQKEIVKQLLYRLPAHKTPRSRFRRTSAPQTQRDWFVSAVFGVLAIAIASLLGLLHPLIESVVPEPWGRRFLAYIVIFFAVTCAAWFIRRLVAGAPAMSASVGAGLTSVTLSSSANTYFDEYLDEIVYFFQASKSRVVVIEDIDRFEDIQVFDTLRALNVLLNSSSALERIVFVYAIRDSIFELIEGATSSKNEGLARRAVNVANRAKFFDVIVPVVPFVNADNARDLMSRAMKSTEFSIDQALIRVAARHLADMRLIHNIRNEFEVYRSRLVVPDSRVYGITDDLVFAMIVFKNAHLADFEKIRSKDSALDHLYRAWRELVRSNLKVEVKRLAELRTALEVDETADERARNWAQRFMDYSEVLRASLQAGNGGGTKLSFVGDINESLLRERATWHALAAGSSVSLQAQTSRGYVINFSFSAEQLQILLGVTVSQAEWGEPVRSELESQITDCEERIRFLRHHTWEELCLRPEFTIQDPQGSRTFNELVHEKAGSQLVEELVRRGFITSHFALYTSTYYGTHLGPDALEYVRRCIEPGEPDTLFQLDEESVQQLLIEQGADQNDSAEIFSDPSMFNVSIVDHLLQNRPRAAAHIARELAEWGELEAEFVATYCARGTAPERLLGAMVPWWPSALLYAADSATLPANKRVPAVDAVLSVLPPPPYKYIVNDKVRDFLETSYPSLTCVVSPTSPERAAGTFAVFASCKAVVRDVDPLNDLAREHVIDRQLYPVTRDNLLKLARVSSIALDSLLQADERVYQHALEHLDDYLVALTEVADVEHTIESPRLFVDIVRRASESGSVEDLQRVVSMSSKECVVDTLAELPLATWPTVLSEGRTGASFTNIHLYIAEYSRMDNALAAFIIQHNVIEWDEDAAPLNDRRDVALVILNAIDLVPEDEVRIARAVQLRPGELPAASISPKAGKFAARLIEENLIPDDALTFISGLMVDWDSREAAIEASSNFESFVSPDTLPVSQIPQFLRSRKVLPDIKKSVVSDITSYLAQGTEQQAEECARALNAHGWTIGVGRIQALIAHGVSSAQIIELILRERDMPVHELRKLLREIGEPYARLADLGRRPVTLPDNQMHHDLLHRLDGVTVSTYRKMGQKLRVYLLRTEK